MAKRRFGGIPFSVIPINLLDNSIRSIVISKFQVIITLPYSFIMFCQTVSFIFNPDSLFSNALLSIIPLRLKVELSYNSTSSPSLTLPAYLALASPFQPERATQKPTLNRYIVLPRGYIHRIRHLPLPYSSVGILNLRDLICQKNKASSKRFPICLSAIC